MHRALRLLLCILFVVGCGDKRDPKKSEPREERDKDDDKAKRATDAELSVASRRLVCRDLTGDLTIDAYVTKEKATESAVAGIEALLKKYERATFDPGGGAPALSSKVKTKVTSVVSDADRQAAAAEGVQEQMIGEAVGANSAVVTRVVMGFVIRYKAEKEVVAFWAPDDVGALEWYLSRKIREVRARADGATWRIGVLDSKSGPRFSDGNLAPGGPAFSLASLATQYFPMYRFEGVDLRAGDAEIDPALRGVLVMQPRQDFNEKELRRLDQFVMRGDKSLVIVASAVNVAPNDPRMTATLAAHGLERLTAGYGMTIRKEAVLDYASAFSVQARHPSGVAVAVGSPGIGIATELPDEQIARIDTAFAPFFRTTDFPLPFASPIELRPEAQPGARVRVVARTSDRAAIDTRTDKVMTLQEAQPPQGPMERFAIAAVAEGTLTTAFPSGDDLGVKAAPKTPLPSRVLLLASSQFFANPFVVAADPSPAAPRDPVLDQLAQYYAQQYLTRILLVFFNTAAWMIDDPEEAALALDLPPVAKKAPGAAAASSAPSTGSPILDWIKK